MVSALTVMGVHRRRRGKNPGDTDKQRELSLGFFVIR
jgi:hypothetical protein